jgi:DNA-binding NarL/FixJ family response regulator
MAEPPRVMIVEDRRQTAEQLWRSLGAEPGLEVAPPVDCVADALEALPRLRPRIVVTDIGLPDGSGLEVVRACADAPWPCEAIVVSVVADGATVVDAIRAGARGYVLKFEALDGAGGIVRTVLAGGSPISPQVARHILTQLDRSAPLLPEGAELTRREAEILGLVARGYRREEVAARLAISVSTVGTHINSIYRKLRVRSNIEAVAVAGRMGLL